MKRILAFGLVYLVIGLILFLLAEGALRARAYLMTGTVWGVEETFVTDAQTGLRIARPGMDTGRILINSHGFRGPEIPEKKPSGTIRIAFLGGSTTYCAEVSSNDRVWAHVVTRKMRERFPDVQFDYINGGVPGYGAEASLKSLAERVVPFSPDVIVIYHATNDLSYHTFQSAVESGLASERADNQRFWLSNYSLLSNLVELNLKILLLQNDASTESGKLVIDEDRIAPPFREDLLALARAAKDAAPVVAIATFSVQYRRGQSPEQQVQAATTSLYYMPYMSIEGLLQSFAAYNSVIRDVAKQEEIVLIGNEDHIPGNPAHFTDSVHFTDAGSLKMAERVTEALLASRELALLVEKVED